MGLTTLGRVARNSIAMTAAFLVKRVAHFVLHIFIARELGVLVFGQFSLAYAFYLIFQVPAMFGLGNLIVREVAKRKEQYGTYLVNAHLIVLVMSVTSMALWVAAAHALDYSPQVIRASALLGLALIPFSMSKICEAIFQAFERMQFIVYTFAAANVLMLGILWFLLRQGYGLMSIMLLLVSIELGVLLLELYFIHRFLPKTSYRLNFDFCRKLARISMTFLGIGISTSLFLQLNVIVLSKFRGEADVGLYNAAYKLSYSLMFISLSLKQAIYPVLSRLHNRDTFKFQQYSERSIEFLISFYIPLALAFFLLADGILLLYREEFVPAAPVLRVLGWILIPLSFERILGGVLLASGHQKANLRIIIWSTLCMGLFSSLFIHLYGLIGAAMAFVAGLMVSFALHYVVVRRQVFPISIPRITWRPLLSGLVLVLLFMLLRQHWGWIWAGTSAIGLYLIVLLVLNHLTDGPLGSWKAMGLLVKPRPQTQVLEP